MARWQPDARGRMVAAAMDLFEERGFDRTTAAEIAERAGVTERTFFRHFADKREVLFHGTTALEEDLVGAIEAAPRDATPLEAALIGVRATEDFFAGRRDQSARRTRIVVTTPALRERELLKMGALTAAAAGALAGRGVPEPTATLAAHSAVAVLQVAFDRWMSDERGPEYGVCLEEAVTALRSLT